MGKSVALLIFYAVSFAAYATTDVPKCLRDNADRYGVNRELVWAIVRNESSGNPRAVHYNTDKSRDIGYMQINSYHLERLNREGVTEQMLYDVCTNVQVGMQILDGFIKQYGYTWRAVGAYGAGNRPDREAARQVYANKVAKRLYGTGINTKPKDQVFGQAKQLRKSRMQTWESEHVALLD